ncbi:MAG: hypothetical protein JWO69_2054 [Thermoleophilia bacterium]|nr:hypothetical protein [Thermoleophilia bacterium]
MTTTADETMPIAESLDDEPFGTCATHRLTLRRWNDHTDPGAYEVGCAQGCTVSSGRD